MTHIEDKATTTIESANEFVHQHSDLPEQDVWALHMRAERLRESLGQFLLATTSVEALQHAHQVRLRIHNVSNTILRMQKQ